MKYSDNKVQLGVSTSRSRHHESEPENLSTKRLVGAFLLWAFGMALSATVFLVELFLKFKPLGF